MNKNISGNAAILAAVGYAQIAIEEAANVAVRRTDGLYEVTFETDWMRYDCFVDLFDGEVLGFGLEPLPEPTVLCEQAMIPA